MTLSNADVTRLLLSLVLLLVVAHGLGRLCTRLRQPKVAGEILGGLLLGPTLFGLLLPSWQHAVFQSGTATPAALGVFYQLGLLLLMYCSGAELRTILGRRERKATIGIALLANAAPFVAGLVFLRFYDSGRFLGRAQNPTAFLLVFALAMAVTSIPVIARIMADLGILGTRFARIVLSVAVLEDLLVYMVLNFALALVAPPHAETFSLPSLLSLRPASVLGNGYYLIVTLGFFALPALLGRGFVDRLVGWRGNFVHHASPIALNARGGPGIVLASVAFDAGIIDPAFYTILVLLALVTSVLAGSWLEAMLRRGEALLTETQSERSRAE